MVRTKITHHDFAADSLTLDGNAEPLIVLYLVVSRRYQFVRFEIC